jgi:hypothetical protein
VTCSYLIWCICQACRQTNALVNWCFWSVIEVSMQAMHAPDGRIHFHIGLDQKLGLKPQPQTTNGTWAYWVDTRKFRAVVRALSDRHIDVLGYNHESDSDFELEFDVGAAPKLANGGLPADILSSQDSWNWNHQSDECKETELNIRITLFISPRSSIEINCCA